MMKLDPLLHIFLFRLDNIETEFSFGIQPIPTVTNGEGKVLHLLCDWLSVGEFAYELGFAFLESHLC